MIPSTHLLACLAFGTRDAGSPLPLGDEQQVIEEEQIDGHQFGLGAEDGAPVYDFQQLTLLQ